MPELDDELPPVPGSPGAQYKPEPAPQSLVDHGQPPEDSMAAAKWAHRLLMLQAYETAIDVKLSQADRRKEIRVILAGAAKHMNDAMRFDVKQAIDQQRRELEERKRAKAAAKLEARPNPGGAKIIPIRRDG